jgi:expansin (peptidoglycan-binding protein)
MRWCSVLAVVCVACGPPNGTLGPGATTTSTTGSTTGGTPPPPIRDGETFGDVHEGTYHLGPVDFAQTMWPNACAPYPAKIQELTGPYLGGVDASLAGNGSLCDACALVTTRLGKKVMVRLVTYGASNAVGDMDLSPEAYNAIHEDDPQGRPMSWQLAKCATPGNIYFQYQTGANVWWTSLWVRNGKLPIEKLEVMGKNHAAFTALDRGSDGTFTDGGGFGDGPYDLRVTARGQTLMQSFPGFSPGDLVESTIQY